jgi:hypothetical protein
VTSPTQTFEEDAMAQLADEDASEDARIEAFLAARIRPAATLAGDCVHCEEAPAAHRRDMTGPLGTVQLDLCTECTADFDADIAGDPA